MGPRCSCAETQVCHRSYIIAAKGERTQGECVIRANGPDTPKKHKNKTNAETNKQRTAKLEYYIYVVVKKQLDVCLCMFT